MQNLTPALKFSKVTSWQFATDYQTIITHTHAHTHTQTHTTILCPSWILSGTTQVSRHQKGKTKKVKPIWIYWSKR